MGLLRPTCNQKTNKMDDIFEELRYAAFEVLLLHPATTRDTWVQLLLEQYPTEVIDALGTDEENARERLNKMWGEDYTDTAGETRSYADWAALFATENDVSNYYKTIPM